MISDVAHYATTWKKWWTSLQLESRCKPGTNKLPRDVNAMEQWEELCKGGLNGFFMVVVSLVWWKAAIKNALQGKIYRDTLEDVSWVLD